MLSFLGENIIFFITALAIVIGISNVSSHQELVQAPVALSATTTPVSTATTPPTVPTTIISLPQATTPVIPTTTDIPKPVIRSGDDDGRKERFDD